MDATAAQYADQTVGMCLGVIDGNVSLIRCYGEAQPPATAAPDASTLFGMASVTKTFTATQLATAVVRNRVALANPVKNFIPAQYGSVFIPRSVRLLDLAQHASGLPRDPEPDTISTFPDLYRETSNCYEQWDFFRSCLVAAPRDKSIYSNWGFELLGIILGRRDGFAPQPLPSGNVLPPWEPDLRQHVLDPLGLEHTSTYVGFDQRGQLDYWASHRATPFLYGGSQWDPPFKDGAPTTDAEGGLYTDSNDMMSWLRYSMTGIAPNAVLTAAHPLLFDTASINRTTTPTNQIGLAWNITSGNGYSVLNKAGGIPGYSSFISFVKGQNLGSFVLANRGTGPQWEPANVSCTLMQALSPAHSDLPCPFADDTAP